MTTLEARPSVALDESAQTFISTFMAHVATVTGYGTNRFATIAGIKTLLLAAMARGADTSGSAWRSLYRAIALLVSSPVASDMRSAHAYLQTFISENRDLADDFHGHA